MMLKPKADTDLRNAKYSAEVQRFFFFFFFFFLPHRSGSSLRFHLRSPGTGDRLILSQHCLGGSVMCSFEAQAVTGTQTRGS